MASIAAAVLFCAFSIMGARAATITLDQLHTLVSGLGYDASVDAATSNVGITDQAKAKVNIYFQLSADRTSVNIYAPFSDVADEKKPDMPMAAMLKANNTNPFLFAISSNNDKERIELDATFDAALITKTMLRKTIDQLVATIDDTQPLWDQDQWVTGGASKGFAAAEAEFQAVWERSPLRADNAMFVTEKAPMYGAFTARPSAVFKKGEALVTYLELKAYTWKPIDDKLYDVGVFADVAISDAKGDVVFEKKKFFSQSFKSHDRFEDLMLNLTLTVDGFPPADYTLRYTVSDANSDKKVVVTSPFKLTE